ncbi:PREDICTED: protein AF-17 [Corvus brachyrhynchos]|uniref:protein AF-17 n=1 Tax=Corvus brachyrhynchos TaxID=85066 RepID=UPI00081665CD|nr:PREDICTED: protein AF-17 [Corvus brachyrhynchos]
MPDTGGIRGILRGFLPQGTSQDRFQREIPFVPPQTPGTAGIPSRFLLGACYGIVQVPTGPWFCRKCESQERAARVRCELCPHKDGALKRTDNGGWAHVVCALYIPEVQFANVLTMEPIVLQYVPHDRFNKTCYICEEQGRESKAASGACMACNRHGCRQAFHVTCAQMAGLLCEEEVLEVDNVKYCGYCKYHFNKMVSLEPGIPGSMDPSPDGSQMDPNGSRWIPPETAWIPAQMDPDGSRRILMDPSRGSTDPSPDGSRWIPMDPDGSLQRGSTDPGPDGSRWIPMDPPEAARIPLALPSQESADSASPDTALGGQGEQFLLQRGENRENREKEPRLWPPPVPGVTPVSVPSQGSSGHHEATKDSSEVARQEVKGRKSSGHGSSHKGKKTGSGKSSGGFGSAASGGTFQAAGPSCSSLQSSQDFVAFPKLEQEDEKFRKAASSSSSSHCSPLYEGPKGDVFEQKVIFSGFGSIMRFSTSAVSQQRARDASPVDYKASNALGGPSGGTAGTAGTGGRSHKGMPSLSAEEGEVLKEKKHKGSKKNKHGPGRPKGGKGKEVLGAQLAGSTSTSSSPFSGGSLVSSSVGNSSRSFSHPGNLPSLSMESPLLGSGMFSPEGSRWCSDPFSSLFQPFPAFSSLFQHFWPVSRAACTEPCPWTGGNPASLTFGIERISTNPISITLGRGGGRISRSPFASSIPASSSSSGSTTQVFSLAGSTFSLPSSHIFGSPLTSGLSLNPLLSQPESSRAGTSRSKRRDGNGQEAETSRNFYLQRPEQPGPVHPARPRLQHTLLSKSPPCKNSFGIENSLSTSSEVQRPLQPPAAGQALGQGPAQPQDSVASS